MRTSHIIATAIILWVAIIAYLVLYMERVLTTW